MAELAAIETHGVRDLRGSRNARPAPCLVTAGKAAWNCRLGELPAIRPRPGRLCTPVNTLAKIRREPRQLVEDRERGDACALAVDRKFAPGFCRDILHPRPWRTAVSCWRKTAARSSSRAEAEPLHVAAPAARHHAGAAAQPPAMIGRSLADRRARPRRRTADPRRCRLDLHLALDGVAATSAGTADFAAGAPASLLRQEGNGAAVGL